MVTRPQVTKNENLIDTGYIREGETWKDIDVSEFGSRLEILQRLEEKKLGYLISKENIPGYFYQSSYISSDTNILELNIIYKIDELYDFYILNNKFSYSNSSSSDVIWEVANIDLPDSFGKIKAISANKFIYEYSLMYYNSEFGYYGYKQDDEIYTIELNITQVPSFLFDSKGNLKDDYISFRDNLCYLVKVNDVTKLINSSYTYLRKNTSALNNGFIYFEIYFNFNLPIDTLEYIEFNLPIRKVIKVFDWIVRSEAFLTNMKMSVHKDEKVSHLNINNSNWFNHFFSITKKENSIQKGDYLINKLLDGENIALISDAGMPGISDPGEDLIKQAIENNIEIDVLPGATAFTVALVGSGLDTHKFVFEGFLDRDKKLRRKRLEEIQEEDRTMIFYESPHRLKDTLKDMLKFFGNRKIAVNRELTKKYQEVIREDIETVLKIYEEKEIKGEFVLIVDGFKGEKQAKNNYDELSEREYVEVLINTGLSKKDAIKTVCKDRKLKKDVVYKQVLDL